MSRHLGAYKKTSVNTASKEQILLMLYQAAIKNCKKAIEAIENKEIAAKGEFIGKLQDIVIELNSSLDFEVGGDVALSTDECVVRAIGLYGAPGGCKAGCCCVWAFAS